MEFAVEYLVSVFDSLWEVADRLYTHFGVYPFIFGGFFVFTVCKFLLIPLFGGFISAGSSDVAAGVRMINRYKSKAQPRIGMKREKQARIGVKR